MTSTYEVEHEYGTSTIEGVHAVHQVTQAESLADRVTGESVGRFEFDEAEGIAFWVSTSYEEAANMNRLSWYSEWIDHLECGSSTAEARHEGIDDE